MEGTILLLLSLEIKTVGSISEFLMNLYITKLLYSNLILHLPYPTYPFLDDIFLLSQLHVAVVLLVFVFYFSFYEMTFTKLQNIFQYNKLCKYMYTHVKLISLIQRLLVILSLSLNVYIYKKLYIHICTYTYVWEYMCTCAQTNLFLLK